ncbi:MAG: Ig-like domain repeat protein [Treponema sp.]|jgi:hypothetical protein|nr:Ig-like domain repeat protein [Treponema sp.]
MRKLTAKNNRRGLGVFLLVTGMFLFLDTALWAGGRKDKSISGAAEGRQVWQKEFPLGDLKPGKYNVLVQARDSAGNVAQSGPFNVILDPMAGLPAARVVNPEPGQVLRQDIQVIGVASGRFGVNQVMLKMDDREYSAADGTDYWSRRIRIDDWTEGRHTLYAQAFDSKGMAGPEFSVSFIIDKAPPTMEITSHQTGQLVSGAFDLAGQADDPNNIASIEYSADGEHWTPLAFKKQRGKTSVLFSVPIRTKTMEDGPMVCYLRSADTTGASITRPYLFFVDNNSPELEILSPGRDEDVYGKVLISGRIYDRVGVERFYYEWAGETVDIPLRPGDPFWTFPLEISAAQSRSSPLRITAVDRSGNTVTLTQRLQDNRRNKTPVVSIDYPGDRGLSSLPVNGAVYGRIAPGFLPASVILEGQTEYLDARSTFRIPPEMIAAGRSSVKLWALSEDKVMGEPLTLRLNRLTTPPAALADGTVPQYDLTPSAVTVSAPARYAWVSDTFTLQGAVSAAGARVEYRFSPEDPWKPLGGGDSRLNANISLADVPDGPLHFELRTIRQGVENFPYYYPLNKYSSGPEIAFLFPAPELGSVHGTVTVTGFVDYTVPLQSLAWSVNGRQWTPLPLSAKYGRMEFSFPCDFTALNNARGSLTVRALDAAGVTTEKTLDVSFDASGDLPVLVINTPADQQVITGNFEVSGVAFDDDSITAVYWRIRRPGDSGRGEFTKISTTQSFQAAIPFSAVVDGENILEIFGEDVYGVRGDPTALTLRVSTAAPVTTVQSPQLGKYSRREITVSGVASDANGIAEVLVSMDNGVTYQKAEGGERWSLNLNTAAYLDGAYSVLLRTIDKYGVESFSNTLINIDNTPPEITLGAPRDGEMAGTFLGVAGLAVSGLDVTGQAHDAVGLESLSIKMINLQDVSRQVSFAVNPNFVIQESLDVSRLPAGQYSLKLNALDFAGNETTVTRNVFVSLNRNASELALVNPMPGEHHTGPLVISGQITGSVIPSQVTLQIDGQNYTMADVDAYGIFYHDYPQERLVPGAVMRVSAFFNTPTGDRIESPVHEISVNPWGPALQVESHQDGDVITQRPWLSGRAWIAMPDEEAAALKRADKKQLAVRDVLISFDNGRSFEKASGKEQWKIRLETGSFAAGPLPIIIRAEFEDGRSVVRRILLMVDTSAPAVETVSPAENSTHRDTLLVFGSASDDYDLETVELSLRPGDKAGYSAPQFIQGLYADFHVLGATPYEYGLGLTFFENNVKLQFQAGQAEPGVRYTGWVFGIKLLANVAHLPFEYFWGPDWAFFSMSFALGADFSIFTMEPDKGDKEVYMGAILGQWEFIRIDFSHVFPKWKYFKTIALYAEPSLWFASSDIKAAAIPRICFGARWSLN